MTFADRLELENAIENEFYRGGVRDGTVVFLEPKMPLSAETEVLVTPLTEGRGSSAAVLAAMAAEPQVPTAWVGELEQQTPTDAPKSFADDTQGQESP